MTDERTTLAIVDDHAMVLQALCTVLAQAGWVDVVGRGGDADAAVSLAREARPEVLVLDYNLPGGGALAVLAELARQELAVKVLILTMHQSWHYAVRALEAGAQGFLLKSSAVEELLEAIQQVKRGEIYVTPSISQPVLDHLRRPRAARVGLAALSAREFEILRTLASGLGIKEVARQLDISVSTASTYRARLMKKLEIDSTADLIRFALEHGLVE